MQANYCYLDRFFRISCKLHILKGVQLYPVSVKMDGFSWNVLHTASHHRQGKTMMVLASSICKVNFSSCQPYGIGHNFQGLKHPILQRLWAQENISDIIHSHQKCSSIILWHPFAVGYYYQTWLPLIVLRF